MEFRSPIHLQIGRAGYYETLSSAQRFPLQLAQAQHLVTPLEYSALNQYLASAVPLLPLTVMGFFGGAIGVAAEIGSALLSSGALAGFRPLAARTPMISIREPGPARFYRPPSWRR